MKKLSITVYGADEKCQSCLHLPSAKETFEWLEAAVSRKFSESVIAYRYVEIDKQVENALDKKLAEAIKNGEYMYPLVAVNGEVVAEGSPKLKDIFMKIEQWIENNPVI
ncbi:DUF1462 family protein [bacterium LRH843]|nr:DUF1462 family protein [bacterium LRH843]